MHEEGHLLLCKIYLTSFAKGNNYWELWSTRLGQGRLPRYILKTFLRVPLQIWLTHSLSRSNWKGSKNAKRYRLLFYRKLLHRSFSWFCDSWKEMQGLDLVSSSLSDGIDILPLCIQLSAPLEWLMCTSLFFSCWLSVWRGHELTLKFYLHFTSNPSSSAYRLL